MQQQQHHSLGTVATVIT